MESDARRRRYGDKEVGLILKRAAELQRLESEATVGGGLTLAELAEVLAEAGIDPRQLRRAADELDAGAVGLGAEGLDHLLGAPSTIRFERRILGEYPESDFELLVPDIQAAAEGVGQPSALGRTLTWQSTSQDQLRSLQVSVSSRDGQTWIRIEERLGQLAASIFGGFVGGGGGGVGLGVGLGVGIGALGSAAFAIFWPLGIIGGS